MKIKNVIGSSKVSPNPPAGYCSWIDYWKTHQTLGAWLIFKLPIRNGYDCPMCGTQGPLNEVVGGHVQKLDSSDKSWYIYPICDSCNKEPGKISQEDITDIYLVPMPSNLP